MNDLFNSLPFRPAEGESALTGAAAAIVYIPCALWLPEGEWFYFLQYFLTLFTATTLAPFLFKALKI